MFEYHGNRYERIPGQPWINGTQIPSKRSGSWHDRMFAGLFGIRRYENSRYWPVWDREGTKIVGWPERKIHPFFQALLEEGEEMDKWHLKTNDGSRLDRLIQDSYGLRGTGYLGQNGYHADTYDMHERKMRRAQNAGMVSPTDNPDQRKANAQANALRFFRSRGYRV